MAIRMLNGLKQLLYGACAMLVWYDISSPMLTVRSRAHLPIVLAILYEEVVSSRNIYYHIGCDVK
jgi:hypothetical protein